MNFFPAVTDIDTSGIHSIEELLSALRRKNVEVYSNPYEYNLAKLSVGTVFFFLTLIVTTSSSCVALQLIIANPGHVVLDKLYASDFAKALGEDKLFLTVADAITVFGPNVDHS